MGTEQYSVSVSLTDGALNIVAADSSKAVGVVGAGTGGTAGQIYPFSGSDTQAVKTQFPTGDLPDQIVKQLLESKGKTAYGVRGAASTAGAAGAATLLSGTGPVVPTFGGAPNEDALFRVRIMTTGSQTTATFQFSLDEGRTWSPTKTAGAAISLGQGSTITFPTGTFTAGAIFEAVFVGPRNTLADMADAADALIESPYRFGMMHMLGTPANAADLFTLAAALDTKAQAAVAVGKMFDFILEAPAVDPALLVTAAAGFTGMNVVIFGGYADLFDENDRRVEKLPLSRSGVPRLTRNPLSVTAMRNETDSDPDPFTGNVTAIWPNSAAHDGTDGYIDSSKLPGLNDARFSTATTIPGRGGSYITNVFTFADLTSDFLWYPNKRAANRGREVLFDFAWKNAQRRLPLDAQGNIDPVIATGIQDGARNLLEKALVNEGHATRVSVVLDRASPTVLRFTARAQVVSHARSAEVDFGLALAIAA